MGRGLEAILSVSGEGAGAAEDELRELPVELIAPNPRQPRRRFDEEALAALKRLTRTEGIIPALEPAHALARARDLAETHILVCLSGRGDKDLAEVLAH